MDGCTLDTQGEKERVIQCIEAAIRRRVSEVTFRFELISLCLFNYCKKKKKKTDQVLILKSELCARFLV